jgi:hypothetical protein
MEVIENSVRALIRDGNVQDLHDLFSSGVVHPFLRESDGYTVLHVSRNYDCVPELD